MCTKPYRGLHGAGALAALAVLAATCPVLGAAEDTTLYHVFRIDRPSVWVQVRAPVDATAWRLGSPDGPPATAAQLAAVRGASHAVVVGAACEGSDRAATHHPCEVELSVRSGAAASYCEHWQGTGGETLTRFDDRGERSSIASTSMARTPRVPTSPDAVALPDEGFVGLQAVCAPWPQGTRIWALRIHPSLLAGAGKSARKGWLVLSTRALPLALPAASIGTRI